MLCIKKNYLLCSVSLEAINQEGKVFGLENKCEMERYKLEKGKRNSQEIQNIQIAFEQKSSHREKPI